MTETEKQSIIDLADQAFDWKGNKLWVRPKNKTLEEVKKQIEVKE